MPRGRSGCPGEDLDAVQCTMLVVYSQDVPGCCFPQKSGCREMRCYSQIVPGCPRKSGCRKMCDVVSHEEDHGCSQKSECRGCAMLEEHCSVEDTTSTNERSVKWHVTAVSQYLVAHPFAYRKSRKIETLATPNLRESSIVVK